MKIVCGENSLRNQKMNNFIDEKEPTNLLSFTKHCTFRHCKMRILCHGKLEKFMEGHGFLKAKKSTNDVSQ